MARRNLRVVRLIEPELCADCRFAKMANVEAKDGTVQRMVHCTRLDCDNWDYESAKDASDLDFEDEAA